MYIISKVYILFSCCITLLNFSTLTHSVQAAKKQQVTGCGVYGYGLTAFSALMLLEEIISFCLDFEVRSLRMLLVCVLKTLYKLNNGITAMGTLIQDFNIILSFWLLNSALI